MIAKKLWLAAALSAASFGGGIGLTIASGWLITMASQQPPILTLTVAIVGVRFFGISRSAFRYAERIMSHTAVFQSLASIRVTLFRTISLRPITAMRALLEGSFAKRVVDDVERAQEFQLRHQLPRLSAIFSVGLGTLIGAWISPQTLLFTLPAAVLFFFIIPALTKSLVIEPSFALEEQENTLTDQLALSHLELKEAEIFGYAEKLRASRIIAIEKIANTERALLKKISILQALTILTLGGALIGAIYVARSLHNPPSVRITMVIFIPLVIYEAVTAWYPSFFTSGKLVRAQRSVDEIMSDSRVEAKKVLTPQGGEIRARSVAVSWGAGFMKPVSFSASPSRPLLLTGENGSGKSTLAMGLVGLLTYQGSLLLCGEEVSEIGNSEDFIAASLQQTHIFNTSIRENLKISRTEATDEEIIAVLRLVELDYLSLDEVVGEFGRALSGGESKRLSVARTLLSKAPIVLLDEPLEHLDADRAERIEKAILSAVEGRTLIVIAHSGWKAIDNTLVLSR